VSKIKKEEMETTLQIATTYLGTEILEELKTSPDLPNNIHGLLEIAIRRYREPLNAVSECLTWIRQATNPNIVLARILQVIQNSPLNFPTETFQTMLAKEAIKDKPKYLPSQIAFDNAYPDHCDQNFTGDSGWYIWMKARIENINSEAARISSHSTQINHLHQAQVEDWNMHINHLNQRLNELETEATQLYHVPVK
jgi:hypothetical protein